MKEIYNLFHDDYIKFIRFGQYFIEKNGEGILAYISNNSFIDGIIHRQMRKNLLESFDKIYILDLHGNAKKNEVCPDGSTDENVFDIMQGVSINIFVKTSKKKKKELGQVNHYDLFGKREFKYKLLNVSTLKNIKWNNLDYNKPNYFFVLKNFEDRIKYEKGFIIDELIAVNSVGIVTSRDAILISDSESDLIRKIENYYKIEYNRSLTKKIAYRLFDEKFVYYDVKLIDRARDKVMKHLFQPNIALIIPKQAIKGFQHTFISNTICDKNLIDSAGQFGAGNVFPLYLYPDTNEQQTIEQPNERTPNLNKEIVNQLAEKLGLKFTNEKGTTESTFAPIDILDYIYAVLHSPTYRSKYKEFLKIDFPRVPYPKDADTFWKLVKLGGELRQIHLLESPVVNKFITTYPVNGSNEVVKLRYEDGKVWINNEQYFDKVPLVSWEFYIGGYQPAQKWLKDRKGRVLSSEDTMHYQKIIMALSETDRIMKEIDKIDFIE